MENRNKKVIMLVGLIVGVLLLSIGFAAFANNLTISGQAAVTPNSADFRVVFSNAIDDEDDEDPVAPTKTPNTITATSASIDNTTSPTLSNISVSFTEPGQKAVYNLYVYNAGKYIANLNSVTFQGTKSCTPGTGADSTMVASACNSITMTVKVGSTTYSSTTNNITGVTLGIGQGVAVQVTVEYAQNGARADGPFTVTFNDIVLNYASVGSGTISQNNTNNGSSQTLEPAVHRYYTWAEETHVSEIGEPSEDEYDTTISLSEIADSNLSNIDTHGYPFYIALDSLDNETVSAAYVCFVRNNTEYCLKGYDTLSYSSTIDIIETAFSDLLNTNSCSFNDDQVYDHTFDCIDSSFRVKGLWLEGHDVETNLQINSNDNNAGCYINPSGDFGCSFTDGSEEESE